MRTEHATYIPFSDWRLIGALRYGQIVCIRDGDKERLCEVGPGGELTCRLTGKKMAASEVQLFGLVMTIQVPLLADASASKPEACICHALPSAANAARN